MKHEPKPSFDPSYIRNLSEQVYRLRLEQESHGNVARMIERDEDKGQKLRNRAGFYDSLTRTYLEVLGFKPEGPHPEIGCGTPGCTDPNCKYGKGPNTDPLSSQDRGAQ